MCDVMFDTCIYPYVHVRTLHHQVAVPHMAEVLTEIFTGSVEIALKVKEEQVERIFQLISNGKAQVELISTLQAMAKVHVHVCVLCISMPLALRLLCRRM